MKTFDDIDSARIYAKYHTTSGNPCVVVERSRSVRPRYAVIRLPKVGEKVFYIFNGDKYPEGTVKSISPSLKVITTSKNRKYYRDGDKGIWYDSEKLWSLSWDDV